ncbi:hypothetical protein PG993_011217 [Apiospora rasikravindrae]|uniref:Nephrocystin 3-like N-terminal domain-containing protein n=1 Tax=Apiospora rasikravindrae TaxID=990691 RepID=A0ABR1SDX3_9PEZI
MEPLAALGIAAAVVQFVDFGTAVIRESSAGRRDGKSLTHTDFATAVKDLISLNQSLKNEFPTGPRGPHEAVSEIQNMSLEVYQRQVNLRALAFISEKLGILTTVTKGIEGEVFNIKEILALDQRKLVQTVKGESAQLQRCLEASDALHRQGRQDLIAAILTLQNGDVRVLPYGGGPVDPGIKPRMPQNVVRLHYRSGISFDDYQDFQQPVLDFLHFRHLADRYDSISEAHKKTFDWIFCDPDEQGKPWANFSTWLTSSQPCYWINGKAASGKSTLMKHVHRHNTTKALLGQWAKLADMICPAFFFWHLGTELQRSQEGLLRSLLHDIFTQHPRLIISVMPELCREILKREAGILECPTLPELMRWFRKLVAQTGDGLKICFFIDGLDEFHGAHHDLIELIETTWSPSVRFVVSSRPITACLDVFNSHPNLRLQDLTGEDGRHYIQDQLGQKLQNKG